MHCKMNKIRFCSALNRSLVGVIAGLALCQAATAALVVYEDFEYDISGDAGLSGKGSAGDGWGGAWSGSGTIVAEETAMSYTAGDISINGGGQSVKINGTSQAYFTRQFSAITGINEVYFSFLIKSEAGAGADYLNFWLSHDADRANSAGIGDVTASNRFGVRIFGDDTGVNNSVQGSSTYAFDGSVNLLVGRISTAGGSGADGTIFDQIDLWVNPGSTTLGTADLTSDISLELSTSLGLSYFGLQTSDVGAADDYRIDELRIGTSAAGVLSTIPEPSTAALLLGGLTLLAAFGRRARQ